MIRAIAFLVGLVAASIGCAMELPDGVEVFRGDDGKTLVRQCSRSAPQLAAEYWAPEVALIKKIEVRISEYVLTDSYLSGLRFNPVRPDKAIQEPSTLPVLNDFVRQYTEFEVNGTRRVYVNLAPMELWKRSSDAQGEPFVVCDGGPMFWGVEFDVDKNEIVAVAFNGMI